MTISGLGVVDRNAKSPTSSEQARRFVSSLIGQRGPNEPVRALQVLEGVPELRRFKTAVIDLVVEEYIQRRRAGEDVDRSEFASQVPEYRSAVLTNLEVYELLSEEGFSSPGVFEFEPGDAVLGLRLVELLGTGAYSAVFLASETALGDREVVAKLSFGATDEATLLGRLDHPNIVPVHSHRVDDVSGISAITMPFLGRATLADVFDRCFSHDHRPRWKHELSAAVRRASGLEDQAVGLSGGPTFIDGMLTIMAGVCRGLSCAHAEGVTHADIKPSNILVTPDGEPKLLDFNLAHNDESRPWAVGGTLPYMAPEQLDAIVADGRIPASPAVDVYSLGVLMYEGFAGQCPFRIEGKSRSHKDLARSLRRQQISGVPSIRALNPDVGADLERVIQRCMAADPERRPASAGEVLDLLTPLTSRRRSLLRSARQRRKGLLGIGMLCGLVLTLAGSSLLLRKPLHEREYLAGITDLTHEQYSEAHEHFDRALRALPEDSPEPDVHADLLFRRGRAALGLDDPRSAYADFVDALEMDPSRADCRASAGYALALTAFRNRPGGLDSESERDVDLARAMLEAAQEAGVRGTAIEFDIAYCLFRTRGLVASRNAAKRIVAHAPDFAPAHRLLSEIELADAYVANRTPDTSHIDRALDLIPDNPDVRLTAACLYALRASMEEDERARHEFGRRCLDLWQEALGLGLSPQHLQGLSTFNPELTADSRFSEFEPDLVHAGSMNRECLLVDPLPDEGRSL
ncbi:MAG: hypothetical protein DWQ34_00075 [Planctomycetota bacterium]|nr:MAG: hypothetical protein DWQ34_00075 [Planctomycetota bacterium]